MSDEYRKDLVELSSWRIATALVKRHPDDITVFIGYPGGGQNDVLWMKNRKNPKPYQGEILLNRTGTIQLGSRFDGLPLRGPGPIKWENYIIGDHPAFIRQLESHAGLPCVSKSPKSTNRVLTYQAFTQILGKIFIENGNFFEPDRYTVRNGYIDSSGVTGSSQNRDIKLFGFDEKLFNRQETDQFGQENYRFWILYKITSEQEWIPKVGFEESSGTVIILKNKPKKLNLMLVYNESGRKLDIFYDRLNEELKNIIRY